MFSPRAELGRFQSYQPGLSIQEIKRRFKYKDVVKLASNENPLGPSPKARAAYKDAADEIFRYPESRSVDLRRAIAERTKIDQSAVNIGAGSDEVIELLANAYLTPQDEIVVSASSFIQYRTAGDLMGARVVTVPMVEMKHDLMSMASAVTGKTKFVFIANPNNPTGTYNTRPEVERFLSVLPLHVLPVFDEAYFEYAAVNADYPSMLEEYFRHRPMVVLRTFSKIYGLAGLRVGYGAAPEACVAAMDRIRPPFNVSVPAQAAAHAGFYDFSHVKKSVAMNEKEKKELAAALTETGFKVVPSAANFLLFDVRPRTGRALFERLLEKAVITRSVDEYGLPGYLRVTVGTAKENRIFLKALREVVQSP